jgi:hypothetical protein
VTLHKAKKKEAGIIPKFIMLELMGEMMYRLFLVLAFISVAVFSLAFDISDKPISLGYQILHASDPEVNGRYCMVTC